MYITMTQKDLVTKASSGKIKNTFHSLWRDIQSLFAFSKVQKRTCYFNIKTEENATQVLQKYYISICAHEMDDPLRHFFHKKRVAFAVLNEYHPNST